MTKLQAERLRRGLTQTALAFHVGLSASDISKFENLMAKPYPAQGERLATFLGLSPIELLDACDEGLELRARRAGRGHGSTAA